MKMIVAFASVALLAAPAFAQSGTMSGSGAEMATQADNSETSEAEGGQAANGERLICRRVQNDSSTRRTNTPLWCQRKPPCRSAAARSSKVKTPSPASTARM